VKKITAILVDRDGRERRRVPWDGWLRFHLSFDDRDPETRLGSYGEIVFLTPSEDWSEGTTEITCPEESRHDCSKGHSFGPWRNNWLGRDRSCRYCGEQQGQAQHSVGDA
jgi:hypothetical protein